MPNQPPIWPSETKRLNRGDLEINGLGGWLILVQFSLWFALVGSVLYLTAGILPLFAGETWERLTSPDSPAYDAMWTIIIPFEAIGNAVLIIILTVVLILLYKKKRWFVPAAILYFTVVLMLTSVGFMLAQSIPLIAEEGVGKSVSKIIRNLFTCLIWIPYFLRSVRVKNTFVK
ncbi:DUF2569 family protein [Paenibacillus mendelii]|uniref:DUF2569 family protein n=1 Tax=Paenibacillus mendelii TaxID=206163 RepID=A0ABV6J5L9_9BACL|nr:DUF2569 family protein [Paenibacillus mendelii]MCQ6560448.1 DUF2569 domain-containing protein [Paenibacillus mendelii]